MQPLIHMSFFSTTGIAAWEMVTDVLLVTCGSALGFEHRGVPGS